MSNAASSASSANPGMDSDWFSRGEVDGICLIFTGCVSSYHLLWSLVYCFHFCVQVTLPNSARRRCDRPAAHPCARTPRLLLQPRRQWRSRPKCWPNAPRSKNGCRCAPCFLHFERDRFHADIFFISYWRSLHKMHFGEYVSVFARVCVSRSFPPTSLRCPAGR